MSLGKSEQDLKRDLEGIALDLKWSAVELRSIAQRLAQNGNDPQAEALRRMVEVLESGESRLAGHAEAVREGRIAFVADPRPSVAAGLSL